MGTPELSANRLIAKTPASMAMLCISAGYFIYDAAVSIVRYEGLAYLVHGVIAGVLYTYGALTGFLSYYGEPQAWVSTRRAPVNALHMLCSIVTALKLPCLHGTGHMEAAAYAALSMSAWKGLISLTSPNSVKHDAVRCALQGRRFSCGSSAPRLCTCAGFCSPWARLRARPTSSMACSWWRLSSWRATSLAHVRVALATTSLPTELLRHPRTAHQMKKQGFHHQLPAMLQACLAVLQCLNVRTALPSLWQR